MNKSMLLIGAIIMGLSGFAFDMESFMAGGVVLLFIALSVAMGMER